MLGGIIGSFLFLLPSAHGELTHNKTRFVRTKNGIQDFTFQTRSVDRALYITSEMPEPEDNVVLAQSRGTYIRGPSSGLRMDAITARGGEAATQVCGGPIEITNTSGVCRELEYDRDFLAVLQTEGLACARDAAEQAFGFTPTRIGLRTGEGQVSASRRSSNGNYSTHSVGRALDIFEVDIFNGQAHNSVRMHINYMNRRGHRTFYSEFGDCWRDVVVRNRGSLAGTCGSGRLDFNYNSAHYDHMHISLPPLNSNRRAHSLNCT